MKSHLRYIGVIDKSNKVHCVKFESGVNVITGKSSTGKSAMIEIFDYCFGNSEFTVPAGIITDNTQLYFIVLLVDETNIILARSPNKTKAFLKEETSLPDIENISMQYFEDCFFIAFDIFKLQLGRYFGIKIDDTDEDLKDRELRQQKKSRPSVRNMMPFMLQHQNLIANKHAIFYRFDEQKKREQTIDQFKIFSGFVDQTYFIIKQKLADEERTLKKLLNRKNNIDKQQEQHREELEVLLKEFFAITGNKLFDEKAKDILLNPANYLNRMVVKKIDSNYDSQESIGQLQKLKEHKNTLYAQQRTLRIKLKDIDSSVEYTNKYREHLSSLPEMGDAKIHLSKCPFCKTSNEIIYTEANLLLNAIEWLNDELSKSSFLLDSFEPDKKRLEEEIKEIKSQISNTHIKISRLENITKDLQVNRGLDEQGLKVKLKIENILERRVAENVLVHDSSIIYSKNEINRLLGTLRDKYNVEQKLKRAKTYIDNTMKQIGDKFDFEDSYKPINLKFSLETFELWHEKSQHEKIYLRSMGSGANWLYSHLTLFMAFHKYFCSLGNQALIPPILFLDQPSQVYFPTSIKDTEENFDAKKLKEKEGEQEKTDEDLTAVTNLFDQMVKFCSDTRKEFGIEPQIIITDHADNLKMDNADFNSLVNNRRWRGKGRGFINEVE